MHRALALLTLVAACADNPSHCGDVVLVQVDPPSATIRVGERQRFLATMKSGCVGDASEAVWSTSDSSIATVDDNGVATGRRAGCATISARFGPRTGSAALTVLPSAIRVAIWPDHGELEVGDQQVLSATATFDDGSAADVTASADWRTANPDVVYP